MNTPYPDDAKQKVRLPILAEAQNWRCCYCGVKCDIGRGDWNAATREHAQAKAHGGVDCWENEVMACKLCNTGRGLMPYGQYIAKVAEIGRWKAFRWSEKSRKRKHYRRLRRQRCK